MTNLFKQHSLFIGAGEPTAMRNENDIFQDGTLPMARDRDGKLWAISGHTHMGHIGMFRGTSVTDLEEVYPAKMMFQNGPAGVAFNNVPYPEGVLSRGSIWPFGLYICPGTGRFFCFFHNETGWASGDTGYDSFGLCTAPKYDSDFRHIGLLVSEDEGRSWRFDRWILAAAEPCFCEDYRPTGAVSVGQKHGVVRLGSGDFSLFDDPKSEYLYLIYNVIAVDQDAGCWRECHAYLARSRKRDDGLMGDFVKWHDGAFSEAGLFGRETPIAENLWHARAVWSEKLSCYVLSGCAVNIGGQGQFIIDQVVLRTGETLTDWSEPYAVTKDGQPFGNHYSALAPDGDAPVGTIGEKFHFMLNHNGTDVIRYPAELK